MTGATAPAAAARADLCAHPPAGRLRRAGYAARLDRLERRLDVGGVPTAARGDAPAPAGHAPPAPAASAPPRTVSDYTPPSSGGGAGASRTPPGMGGGGRSAGIEAAGGPSVPPSSPGPGDAGRVDAARAEVGAPPVMAPGESVGGPSSVVESSAGGQHLAGASEQVRSGAGPSAGSSGASVPAPESPSAAGQSGEATQAGPAGGMDTDAIRRAWPNVLGRIFTMRRITWTFVSQNAQVTAFDGRTLTLGIATAGLTQTFRAGNHADIVRQALIDELGVDAVVDGIHMDTVSQQTPVAPPPGVVPAGLPDPPSKGDPGGPADGGQGGAGLGRVVRVGRPGVMPARGMMRRPRGQCSDRDRRHRWISAVRRRGAGRRRAEPGLRSLAPGQCRLGIDDGSGPGLGHRSRPRVAVRCGRTSLRRRPRRRPRGSLGRWRLPGQTRRRTPRCGAPAPCASRSPRPGRGPGVRARPTTSLDSPSPTTPP